jgi:hypothetical protein
LAILHLRELVGRSEVLVCAWRLGVHPSDCAGYTFDSEPSRPGLVGLKLYTALPEEDLKLQIPRLESCEHALVVQVVVTPDEWRNVRVTLDRALQPCRHRGIGSPPFWHFGRRWCWLLSGRRHSWRWRYCRLLATDATRCAVCLLLMSICVLLEPACAPPASRMAISPGLALRIHTAHSAAVTGTRGLKAAFDKIGAMIILSIQECLWLVTTHTVARFARRWRRRNRCHLLVLGLDQCPRTGAQSCWQIRNQCWTLSTGTQEVRHAISLGQVGSSDTAGVEAFRLSRGVFHFDFHVLDHLLSIVSCAGNWSKLHSDRVLPVGAEAPGFGRSCHQQLSLSHTPIAWLPC